MHETPDFLDLPELANERVGGAVLAANDDFFAGRDNLLKVSAPEGRDGEFTPHGKWMDGWETRRRREPGHDWCVIRLGLPGRIHGVVVDTSFFRGNAPESCALEATTVSGPLDARELEKAEWVELVPRAKLQGDAKHFFEVHSERRFTHLRLSIFPDGGVARLRVHGEAVPDWKKLEATGGHLDLAALENGASVLACSDMFFGSRHHLIQPGPARTMGEGWETKRRRGAGHDWALVRLAAAGTVERLEVDTTHFKGNAPARCLVEVTRGPRDARPDALSNWRVLLDSPLQPHTRHLFDEQLRRVGPVTHLRLNVFPDGGVARLRAWGALQVNPHPAVAKLNALSTDAAAAEFLKVCGSKQWASAMAWSRPFEDAPALFRIAERAWWKLQDVDFLEAFAAHPRIGSSSGGKWSSQEQSGTATAAQRTMDRLRELNERYFEKNGFIFIINATGKSADEMLAALEGRVANERPAEIQTAAEEQARITRVRLTKWLEEHSK